MRTVFTIRRFLNISVLAFKTVIYVTKVLDKCMLQINIFSTLHAKYGNVRKGKKKYTYSTVVPWEVLMMPSQ